LEVGLEILDKIEQGYVRKNREMQGGKEEFK